MFLNENFKNKHYGTKAMVSDIEQRNVWGAEIYGRGFTVRVKSGRCGLPKSFYALLVF